jgi:hypothetical protein
MVSAITTLYALILGPRQSPSYVPLKILIYETVATLVTATSSSTEQDLNMPLIMPIMAILTFIFCINLLEIKVCRNKFIWTH